ncbi:hypothetical protein LAZ67_3003092 [Cordylochernes scorpioides]|uniref:Reverse transcriptase domain-containing protein n=1 Tax=Cordylochernes scorpioides TaxID=51811 RepID=A0ABY6KBG4_9ARAC|nr:hypothetical protein LAZ67_3003092 [Cordylochernes scorpioides]
MLIASICGTIPIEFYRTNCQIEEEDWKYLHILIHHYREFRGSPMGSPLSTIIAEIVMNRIDDWITHTLSTEIQFWRRYIDDIFVICKKVYHKKLWPPCYTHYNSHCPVSHKINIVRTLTKRIYTHCFIDIFKIIERNRIITQLSAASFPLSFINKYTYTPTTSNPTMTYRSLCFLPYSPSSVDIARKLRSYGIRTIYKNSPQSSFIPRHPHTKSSAPPDPLRSMAQSTPSHVNSVLPLTLVRRTGSTTQGQADLAPKEMAASDMRNRSHVQPLLTWSTNAAHPVSLESLQGTISRAS